MVAAVPNFVAFACYHFPFNIGNGLGSYDFFILAFSDTLCEKIKIDDPSIASGREESRNGKQNRV